MMKKTRKPTPEERIRALYPEFDAAKTVELFSTRLDPTEPTKMINNVVLCTQKELLVWRDDELALREAMENIERVSLGRGVGCCWVEYTRKSDGETILCARADNTQQNRLGKAVE